MTNIINGGLASVISSTQKVMLIDSNGNSIDSLGAGAETVINGISGNITMVSAGSVSVITSGQTITIMGDSSGTVGGPGSSQIGAISTWANTIGSQLQNTVILISGNDIYSTNSVLNIEMQSVSGSQFNIIDPTISNSAFSIYGSGSNTIFLGEPNIVVTSGNLTVNGNISGNNIYENGNPVATYNVLATTSGLAATAIQSASNSGTGFNIFNSKNGTNLIFNTVSGIGTISTNILNGVIIFSGTNEAPIGTYVHISGDVMTGPLYSPVISGSIINGGAISGNTIVTSGLTVSGIIEASGLTVDGNAIVEYGLTVRTLNPLFPNAQEDPFYRYNQQPLLHWVNNPSGIFSVHISGATTGLNYGTFDGENFWVGNFYGPSISKITQSGTLTTYPVSGNPLQLAWDNRYIWIGSADSLAYLYKFDPTTNTVIGSYALNPSGIGLGGIQGLIYDGQYLWAGLAGPGHVVKVNPANGNILQTTPNQANVQGIGVTDLVTSSGSQRYIWAACTDFISQININTNTYQITYTAGSSTYRICNDDFCVYGVDFNNSNLQKYSMTTLQQEYTVKTITSPNSVQFDGKYIWVAGNSGISIHDRNTGSMIYSNSGNNTMANGLVFDGSYMWGNGATNGNVYKYMVGEQLGNLKVYESLMVMSSGNIPAFQMSTKQNALIMNGNDIVGANNIVANSFFPSTIITSSGITLTANNSNVLTNQAGTIQINIPVQPIGKQYTILSTVSSAINNVVISGVSCTINGSATLTLNSASVGSTAFLFSDGSNYWNVGNIV